MTNLEFYKNHYLFQTSHKQFSQIKQYNCCLPITVLRLSELSPVPYSTFLPPVANHK